MTQPCSSTSARSNGTTSFSTARTSSIVPGSVSNRSLCCISTPIWALPHKQRVTQARPGAVQGAKRRSEPLTARTGPHNLALRERGVRGRVAAAEPPSIRALDSLILFPQGQSSYYLS